MARVGARGEVRMVGCERDVWKGTKKKRRRQIGAQGQRRDEATEAAERVGRK